MNSESEATCGGARTTPSVITTHFDCLVGEIDAARALVRDLRVRLADVLDEREDPPTERGEIAHPASEFERRVQDVQLGTISLQRELEDILAKLVI